jgi:non-ribosomal peptide synthetase component F
MPMTAASMFWLDTLHDYNLDRSLTLPYDRYRLSNEHRTSRGTTVSFDFGQHLSHDFLTYASSNNIEPQHLVLAIYYVFLFKLTNGERHLCIGININNRYRDELKSVIGLFENIIPLRCQLDPHWSFHQLLEYGREIMTSSMKYSYFPLPRILDQHPNVTKPAFLNISVEFQSNESENNKNEVVIEDNQLYPISNLIDRNDHAIKNPFDFSVLIQHDVNINQLSCTISASLDLFYAETIYKIAQQFHSILEQLFYVTDNQMGKPIYELSLMLSDEKTLFESINNTQVLFPSATCIHHEFVRQVMKHPQKLALELDDQSLTYCELLHYVQILSLNLMDKYYVAPGEIICQYLERSLSMVS